MPVLEVANLEPSARPTGLWAAALLQALARDEVTGRRRPRLTEPGCATWKRFQGRLKTGDFYRLLFEDAAVAYPIPFALHRMGGTTDMDLDHLPDTLAQAWLATVRELDLEAPAATYVLEQARLLGLPTRLGRSELHVVKPHQKVLELPATGGQLAHHLVCSQDDITLQGNFTIACRSWRELTLAGIIALERGAPSADFLVPLGPAAPSQKRDDGVHVEELHEPDHPLRRRTFDFVIGIHPDKGGFYRPDQLAIWFPSAKALLV